jgi:hypothetical protein
MGSVSIRGERSFPFEEPKRIMKIELKFDLSNSGKPIWRDKIGSKQSYSSEDLAKLSLTMLLNKILDSKKLKK